MIPLTLITLYVCVPAYGQDCTPDKFGKLQELSLGPISFKLKNSTFNPTAGKIVNFTCFIVFNWTASDGTFTYRSDKGIVVEGKVTNFKLKGELAINQGVEKNALNINSNDLDVTLLITKPLKTVAYAGTVSLAAKEEILISNPNPISFSEKAKPIGLLQIRTSNKLNWQGAIFRFPQLTDPIKLDLITEKGTTLDKEFELPLDTGDLRVTRAMFRFSLPASITKKTFALKSAAYRAVVSQLKINEFSTLLQRDSLALQVQGLSGEGEFTGKVVKSSPLPVLFTGKASIANLTGTAAFSHTVADIQGIAITGLQLRPTPVTSQKTVGQLSFNSQVARGNNQHRIAVASPTDGLQSFAAEFSNAHTPAPLQLKPSDFYIPSPGQVNAMRELGIPVLSDQQRAAISASRTTLQSMASPDVLINYPAKDFIPLLEQVAKRFNLKLHDVKFGRQELLLLASFQEGPMTLGEEDAIKFVFRISPSIEKRINAETKIEEQVLVLRYKMGLARIDQTDLSDTVPLENIAGAVDNQLGQADSASQDPTPITIPLPVDSAKPFVLKKSFTDPTTKAMVTVSSKEVQIIVAIANSVLLIDEQGMHLMAVLEAK
jgi:hypothetical protein